jgi:SPP1 gp7 family putative phage head morphogenesis protein
MATVKPFGVRLHEAIRFMREKVPVTTRQWNDWMGPVHAKQFTVAGAPIDVVRDIQEAMIKARDGGLTLSGFRKIFDETVQRNGWSYKGKRGWRTALIYNTNMRQAAMAAKWKEAWENRENRPYMEYLAILDDKTRDQHASWHGTILPITSDWWKTHYPLNGYNCRCTTRTLSEEEVGRSGRKVSEEPEIKYRDVITSDGEIIPNVPEGLDPGWDYNVGEAWQEPEMALGRKLATLPKELQATAIRQSVTQEYAQVLTERWQAFLEEPRIGTPKDHHRIIGFLPDTVVLPFEEKVPDFKLESLAIAAFSRRFSHLRGTHKATGNPSQVWPEGWFRALPMLIWNYKAVLWDTRNPGLLVIPRGKLHGRIPRILVSLNDKQLTKTPVNRVASLGTVEGRNLTEPHLILIAGEL